MEPINGLERLTELVRRKSAEAAAADKPRGAQQPAADGQRPASVGALEQQIQRKVKQLGLNATTPAALQRVVIEAMLAWEFGADDMHNEPKFAALVNRVQRHIDTEPALRKQFETVVSQLA
jgi:hypothetical protein